MMIQIILKKFPRKKNTRKVGVFLDPSEKTTQSLSFPSSSFWATTNSYKTSVVETTVSKRHLSLFCAPEKYTCPTQPFDFFDQGSELILITCARRSGRTVLLAAQRHWFWKIWIGTPFPIGSIGLACYPTFCWSDQCSMFNYPVAHMLTISQGKRASFAHFLISKHQPIIFDGFSTCPDCHWHCQPETRIKPTRSKTLVEHEKCTFGSQRLLET